MTPQEWQALAFFGAAIIGLAMIDAGAAKVTALAVGAVILLRSNLIGGSTAAKGTVTL